MSLFSENNLLSFANGETEPPKRTNFREQIADWFFDHCYYVEQFDDGRLICRCSQSGYFPSSDNNEEEPLWEEQISKDTWWEWQIILTNAPVDVSLERPHEEKPLQYESNAYRPHMMWQYSGGETTGWNIQWLKYRRIPDPPYKELRERKDWRVLIAKKDKDKTYNDYE